MSRKRNLLSAEDILSELQNICSDESDTRELSCSEDEYVLQESSFDSSESSSDSHVLPGMFCSIEIFRLHGICI